MLKGPHLPLVSGLLVGATLGCTSSTVVLPVLQQMEAEEPVKVTLLLEASWGDVLAVLMVGLLLGLQSQTGPLAQGLAKRFLVQVGVALLFAVVAGILWSRLLHVLSEQRFWQVLTFSMVLVLYAGMEALGANGLIAVLERARCFLCPDAHREGRSRGRRKSNDSRRAPVGGDRERFAPACFGVRPSALPAHNHNPFASLAHRWCRR